MSLGGCSSSCGCDMEGMKDELKQRICPSGPGEWMDDRWETGTLMGTLLFLQWYAG